MSKISYSLTKSKITTGLRCPKKLWFDINEKIEKRVSSFEDFLIMEGGYEALLHPSEIRRQDPSLPPIINPLTRRLSLKTTHPVPLKTKRSVEGRVHVQVSGAIKDRWESADKEWPVAVLLANRLEEDVNVRIRDLLGLERRFLVSVGKQGEIQTVQALNPDERDLDGVLGRWLRRQRLAPGEEEIAWGRIRIWVEGVLSAER